MDALYRIAVCVDGGYCPYEAFESRLSGDCLVTVLSLRRQLAFAGTRLPKRIAHDVGGGVWELRGRCQRGAVRIYYWRSGPLEFTLACGEVKKENAADQGLIRFARDCYQKTRQERKQKDR